MKIVGIFGGHGLWIVSVDRIRKAGMDMNSGGGAGIFRYYEYLNKRK
jgi:hypothetical protein